jgi:retron-type reverse transcriptase
MKRFNNLFSKVTAFDNLLLASKKAQKGKKNVDSVARFHFSLENNLFKLQRELRSKSYRPGKYQTFYIFDPKKRMISAAPYRDRVVHHALCNIVEPIFEKVFIYDTYANRKGKGTHKAIERYQRYAQKFPYVLKCDIRKFFPSLDHKMLKEEIRRKIKCKDTLWLIDLIIDHSNLQEEHLVWFSGDTLFTPMERRKGLPIGNLTSQFWGNVYLNRFDHFIKEELRVPGYIRYVDDFVLFGKNKEQLSQWKNDLTQYLEQLRLIPHPNKTQIHKTKDGIPFLGFQVFPHYRYVKKQKVKRYRRYLKRNLELKAKGELGPDKLEHQLNAWLGHIRFGQSQRLEHTIFWYLVDSGVNLFLTERSSWRVLEQQQ